MSKGPEWLDSYLRRFEEGEPLPQNSMFGTAERAAWQARRDKSLEWAAIAIRAAALWASENGGKSRHDALLVAMRLRAFLIAEMGSKPGSPFLDRDIILHWFVSELQLSAEVVRTQTARFKAQGLKSGLTLEEIRTIRRIRHRAAVLKTLAEAGELPEDSPLIEWVEMARRGEIL